MEYNKGVAAEDDYAFAQFVRGEESIFANDGWDYFNYVISEDRLYLPLRSICEGLGEEVEWDGAAKQASVATENGSVPMSGMIVNDRTYIKVRDFEKLGYTITFDSQSDEFVNYVTITK